MKFTEIFGVEKVEEDDWFDPILTLDTKLFIDPFLLFQFSSGYFENSHSILISFFDTIFKIIALSGGNKRSIHWKRAEASLVFPEAEELCLGYTGKGTGGAGSGSGFASIIADAIWESIQAGLKNVKHFEEICILRENIGADRISDITANILKINFINYTSNICQRHSIPTHKYKYHRGIFSVENQRWEAIVANLPTNPSNKRAIMLVPSLFLRQLPTINPEDFWEYCSDNENEILRNELGAEISKKVKRDVIIDFARSHPDIREKYLSYVESVDSKPYDFDTDALGYDKWYETTKAYCKDNSIAVTFSNEEEFIDATFGIIEKFRQFIEDNSGWKLLWNDGGKPKSEEAAQLVFLGIVKHYCSANNIDVSREANIGRGPVDFKVSQGHQFRALIELKKANNSKYWNGIQRQLPKYQDAETVVNGYFVTIILSDGDIKRVKKVNEVASLVSSSTGYSIKSILVDARPQISASKL